MFKMVEKSKNAFLYRQTQFFLRNGRAALKTMHFVWFQDSFVENFRSGLKLIVVVISRRAGLTAGRLHHCIPHVEVGRAHKGFVIIFVSWIIFEAWLEAGDWGWGVVMSAPDCSLLRARRQRRRLEQRAPPTSAPGHWAADRCTSQQRLIVGRRWIYQHEELILGMKSMQWIKWLQIESIPSHHLLNIQLQSLLSRTCDF